MITHTRETSYSCRQSSCFSNATIPDQIRCLVFCYSVSKRRPHGENFEFFRESRPFWKTQRNDPRASFYEIFNVIFRLSTKFGLRKTAFRMVDQDKPNPTDTDLKSPRTQEYFWVRLIGTRVNTKNIYEKTKSKFLVKIDFCSKSMSWGFKRKLLALIFQKCNLFCDCF